MATTQKSIFKPNPLSTWGLTKQSAFEKMSLSDEISVNEGDKLLSYDDGVLSSSLDMVREDNKLTLKGKNGEIAEVELPEHSVLDSASYDETTKEIVLVFDVQGEKKEERISVKDLVDEYTNGKGLKLDGKEFSIDEEVVATVEGVESVKSELNTEIEGVKTTVGEHSTSIEEINSTLEAKLDKSVYDEEKASFETVEHAEATYLKEHQDLSEYAKTSEVDGKLDAKQDKGDYVEYSDYQGRKTIQLKNYDSISGIKTDGTGVNLAMVSKFDVADFGSVQLHINLNGVNERPTYNDDKEIALLGDIPSVEGFIDGVEYVSADNKIVFKHSESEIAFVDTTDFVKDGMIDGVEIKDGNLEITFNEASGKETIKLPISDIFNADNYYTKSEVDTELAKKQDKGNFVEWSDYQGRKIIQLENRDAISSKISNGGGANLIMLSAYDGLGFDVTEVGSTQTALVLNTIEGIVKVEGPDHTQKTIATVDQIPSVEGLATESYVDSKAGEVEAKIPSLEGYVKEEKLSAYTLKSDYDQTHANVENLAGEVAELEADTVKWSDYNGQEGRRILKLAHRDPIAGESPKGGSQIAMVSDYDGLDYPVVELGGSKAAMVLNSNELPVKVELTENGKRVQHSIATLDDLNDLAKAADVTTEINNAVANKADKSELETKQDKGDYVTFKEFDGGRKTINLRDRDTIASEGSQIAMVSTYDGLAFPVLELGGTKAAMVLNTCEDRVKVEVVEGGKRVQHPVATLDDLKDFPKYEPYVNGDINKKTIVLENDDNISGKRTDGLGVNLIEVSRWNVADISSKSVHTNLNGMYERPTYNDKEGIALLSDIEKVKAEMKSYVDALLKNYTLKSDEEIAKIVKAGGDAVLPKDVKAESGFTLTKNANIDLNGHALSAVSNGSYGDTCVLAGADITISDGEIKPADNATVSNASATILVKTASATTLTLNNVKATGIHPLYINSANENTLVTINGGEYYTTMPLEGVSSDQMAPAVYIGKGSSSSTTGGKAIINGGTFGQKGVVNNFLLNVEDILRKQEGKEPRDFIEVFGGSYWNFSPMDNKAEGPNTRFVADGYHVVETKDGDDTLYTVVKDSE